MIDKKRIAEIMDRCEKSTQGPWSVNNAEIGSGKRICLFENQIQGADNKPVGATDSNADFIAHAREDIPYLIDAIAKLQAEYDKLNDFEQSQCAKLLAERGSLIDLAGDWKETADKYHAERNDLQKELAESQRREQAAVEDLKSQSVCDCCKRTCQGDGECLGNGYLYFDWRGPQDNLS